MYYSKCTAGFEPAAFLYLIDYNAHVTAPMKARSGGGKLLEQRFFDLNMRLLRDLFLIATQATLSLKRHMKG